MLPLPDGIWQALTVEGAGGTLRETGLGLVSVLSSSSFYGAAACEGRRCVCRTLSGAHSLASFAGTWQAVSCSTVKPHGFLLCQPQSLGTPVGSDLLANFNPPAVDQLLPRTTANFSAILWAAATPSFQIVPFVGSLSPTIFLRFSFISSG